jgi:putative glutamine amidotransferase
MAMHEQRPVIGIATDVDEKDARVRRAYVNAVAAAGGVPVLLPVVSGSDEVVRAVARAQVAMCDGIVLTGGHDVRTEAYGHASHPKAEHTDVDRQRHDEALLAAIDELERETPTLGICLGMQIMSLHNGGELDQHLPDNHPTADAHAKDHHHGVKFVESSSALRVKPGDTLGGVASWHHQGVRSAGRLKVIAVAEDGIAEAVEDPTKKFYVGVQWHPERTSDAAGGVEIFKRLVEAARKG